MVAAPHWSLNANNGWHGDPTHPDHTSFPDPKGPLSFDQTGQDQRPRAVWVSDALDSERHGCVWDRIEIKLACPQGGTIVISTSTQSQAEARGSPWDEACQIVQRPKGHGPEDSFVLDCLIQSPPAQFCRLKVAIAGNGLESPKIHGLRVHFPRHPLTELLPAVYGEEDHERRFLERFLAIFQRTWDGLEARIDRLPGLFDPKSTPDDRLDYLAGWLALPLEQAWDPEVKRQLLCAAPHYYPRRGTAKGLRDWLAVCLAALNKIKQPPGPDSLPVIVEGFRRRNYLWLKTPRALREPVQLWGADMMARPQVGHSTVVGRSRLYQRGQAATDLVAKYAHSFELFVPASWLSQSKRKLLEKVLASEAPAQTRVRIHAVEPGLCLGVQSQVGLDTILGEPPWTRLASAKDSDMKPGQRLQYDTRLAPGLLERGASDAA